jgi:hypothetical protein
MQPRPLAAWLLVEVLLVNKLDYMTGIAYNVTRWFDHAI